ncbi:Arm DNA-binding domain-containing protein [Sphingobacterium sp. UME9]|uniref:Arm DNA-binding domain-containing protein n=1 Tax=Sphingobacterium sp. UME9 TaxID=1862316 RepID=UPI001600D17D|nr:Arm DNA-binding domain-containing protein [Sphingobacterium sp. UME9]MBB1644622.1 hypothetical protein [Sphingobacterium sp. UME9]
MSTNYSLLFYLKKSKNYVSGPKPIYMRITVDGIPKEVSTGRECDPSKWSSKANRMKGTTEAVKTLNTYLYALASKVSTIHTTMTAATEEITAESIKLRYQGKDIKRTQFLEVFREHNMQMEALLGNGFKPNTLKGYKTSLLHIGQYLTFFNWFASEFLPDLLFRLTALLISTDDFTLLFYTEITARPLL